MTAKENVQKVFYEKGREMALSLQKQAPKMTGTAINAEASIIPDFTEAIKVMNMLKRKAGFICKSSAGRVVKLIQPYDSDIYTLEPEKLAAQWGFVWSDDPAHALPFVAISTSPYMVNNVCTANGKIYKSRVDNNVFPPQEYPDGWAEVKV